MYHLTGIDVSRSRIDPERDFLSWYTDVILWGAGKNMMTGDTSNGYFGPADYRKSYALMRKRPHFVLAINADHQIWQGPSGIVIIDITIKKEYNGG